MVRALCARVFPSCVTTTLSSGAIVDLPMQPSYEVCQDIVTNNCSIFFNATWTRLRVPENTDLVPNCQSSTVLLGAAMNPAFPAANDTSFWDFGSLGTVSVAVDTPRMRHILSFFFSPPL